MSAITAKASRKMKKYAVLTREPRCFLGSFDFSWEQRKLSEITDKVTEKNAGLQYVETFTNSAEFGIISQRDFFDHDIAKLGSLDGYYIVKNEDFVYNPRISTSAPVGPINRNKLGRTGVMSPLYTVFRPHDIDTTYLEYFFKCGYWHSFMNFNGDSGARSDRFSIRDNVFFQMPIPIPDIDEQRKIGELLTCLDNLITLHQRKYALLFSPFQALISMMFTTSTFSWEQRKAIDIADYSKGNGYSKGDLTDAGTPIILYGRLYTKYQFAISEVDTFAFPQNGAVYSQGNEVIVPASGETAEDIARASAVEKSGVLLGGDLNILRPFDFINPLFLALAISNGEPQKELAKKAQGKSVVHIHNTDIQEVTIAYPSRTEQDRIVSVFRQLDNLITLHQRKCISFTGRAGRLISTVNKKRITSSWEQRKFGEVFDCTVPNNTLSRAELSYDEGTVLNVHYGDVLIKYDSVLDVQKDDIPRIPHRCREDFNGALLQDGDVIIADTAEDETTGKACEIGNLQGSAIVSGLHTMVCRPRNRMALGYLGYYLNSNAYHHQLLPLMQGIKVLSLSRSNIQKTSVSYPSAMKEQQLIASYFSQLDHLITLHQRKPFLMKWRNSDANRNQTNRLVL